MGTSSEKIRKVLHQIQIDTTLFRSETRAIRGFQSFVPSVNRTAVINFTKIVILTVQQFSFWEIR